MLKALIVVWRENLQATLVIGGVLPAAYSADWAFAPWRPAPINRAVAAH